LVAIPRPAVHALRLTLLGAFPLAAIPLGAALLLLALFALGDKVHFFAKSFRDPLGDDAFVKASNQLLDGLTFTSLDMHSIGLSTHGEPTKAALTSFNHQIRLGRVVMPLYRMRLSHANSIHHGDTEARRP
jgi:hypothetical protein